MQSVKKIKKRERRWMTRREKKTHSTPSLVAYCLSIEGIWFAHGKNAIICAIWFTWICCLFFLPSAPIIYILLYRVVAFWRVAQNSHETEKKTKIKNVDDKMTKIKKNTQTYFHFSCNICFIPLYSFIKLCDLRFEYAYIQSVHVYRDDNVHSSTFVRVFLLYV